MADVRVPILCYHKVGPEAEDGRRLNVSPETLFSHVRFFSRHGYRFLRAEELHVWPTAKSVCLTFDDGYVSTLTYGVETLSSVSDATATVYAVAGLVGQKADWPGGDGAPLGDVDLLRAAKEARWEVGLHTLSHADLSALPDGEARRQVLEGQQTLASLGFKSSSFAYPYGKASHAAMDALREAEIAVGLGLSVRAARSSDDRLRLPRIVLAFSDRVPKLLYKLHLRPWLPRLKDRPHYVR